MIRNTLTNANLRVSHNPFVGAMDGDAPRSLFGAPRFRAFFDPPDRPAYGTMDLPTFQKTVGENVDTIVKNLGVNMEEVKTLKADAEKAFADVKKHEKSLGELANGFALLQKSSLEMGRAAIRGLPPEERIRSHEDTLKRLGEAVKANKSFVLRAEGEDSGGAGGNLVNPGLVTDIYALEQTFGIASSLFDYRTMGTKTEKLLVETGEPDAVFVGENSTIPEQALSIAQVPITARKIASLVGISSELLEDSVVDLGIYVSRKFGRASARRVDYVSMAGDGTNDGAGQNGGFLGVFNFATAIVAPSGATSVKTMVYDDFLAVLAGVDPQVLNTPGACWMMHPTQVVRCLSVKDGNGRPIFLNALDAPAQGAIGSILGYPVRLCAGAPAADGPDKKIAVFGDPDAYAVGNRREYNFAYSDDARFDSDQRVYRATSRKAFGGKRATALGVLKTHA